MIACAQFSHSFARLKRQHRWDQRLSLIANCGGNASTRTIDCERRMETLYDLLGALPNDNADELRAAFRRAAKGAHPDLHPGDPNAGLRFRRIVRANEILGDTEQRAAYDHLLELAHHEHQESAKHTAAARLHRLATGAMALTAIAAVVLGGSALFLQLSARAAPPAIHGEVALSEPAAVAATIAKAQVDPRQSSDSADILALAVEPTAVPAPADAPTASLGPPLDILPTAAKRHPRSTNHSPNPNNGLAANRAKLSKPKSAPPRGRVETFSDRLRRFERAFAEIGHRANAPPRDPAGARSRRLRRAAGNREPNE
jgi:curved DNA-binding protein CbpA